jgi:hypothetical protein
MAELARGVGPGARRGRGPAPSCRALPCARCRCATAASRPASPAPCCATHRQVDDLTTVLKFPVEPFFTRSDDNGKIITRWLNESYPFTIEVAAPPGKD